MRSLKLRLYTDSDGRPQVCDANTGVPLEGVESAEIHMDPDGARVVLNMCPFSTVVDVEAEVEVINTRSVDHKTISEVKDVCEDCRGTGQYQGLDIVDDCHSCGGVGYV